HGAGGTGPARGVRQLLLQHTHQRRERHARHGVRRRRWRAAAQRRLISYHRPAGPIYMYRPDLSMAIKLNRL
uniref:Uncharacterized protein n=1 Tax=Aegilops tauschii subsp. strangulata TaxID=200361 RepID=A0A453H299_AEGTS